MARRLNKRIVAFVVVFVGVPVAVVAIAVFGGWLGGGDPQLYKRQAREYMDKGQWPQAWIAIRNAIKYGARKDAEAQYMYGQIAMHQVPPSGPQARRAFEMAATLDPNHFEAQRDLTDVEVQMRRWQDVKKDAARLREMDPSFGRGYLWSAVADFGLAQNEPIYSKRVPFYESAVQTLQAGIEKAPDLLDLYRLLASAYQELEQPDKILETMDLAIANNPTVPETYVLKSSYLIETRRIDEAAEVLQQGLQQVPNASPLLMARGEVALARGDSDAAKEFFQQVIQSAPKKEEAEGAYFRLSNLYRVEGNAEAAIQTLRQGLEALPNSTVLMAEQADVFLEHRDVEEADALIAELAKAAPGSAEVDYLRGKRALLDRRTRQAIAYLEEARSKKSTPQTLLLLGRAYLVAGELGAAKKELESLVTSRPDYLGARRSLADVQLRLREFDAAIRNAKLVLQAAPGDVDTRLLMAEAYLAQGDGSTALKEAKTAAEQAPDDPAPLFLVARLCRLANRSADAEAALRRILQLDRTNEQAYRELTDLYQTTGQTAKRAQVVEEARAAVPNTFLVLETEDPVLLEQQLKDRIAADPSSTRDRLILGRYYLMTNRADEAREVLQPVLDQAEAGSDEWRQVWQMLFIQELSSNAYDKAAALVQRLRKVDPEATELLFADALTALSQNRLDEAASDLKRVVQKNPTLSSARYLLGQVLSAQRRWEEAAAELQKALDLRPDLVAARVLLGRIYQAQGNHKAALIEAGEALKFAPRYVPALLLRAESYTRTSDWPSAIGARRTLAEILPNDIANLAELAFLHLRQGDLKEAERVFNQAYQAAPDNGWLVQRFADFYARTGRKDKGRELIDKYVADHPDQPAAYLLRGAFLASNEGMDQARPDYEKASALAKDNAQPLVLLGDAYLERGRLDDALRAYQKAATRPEGNELAKKRLADAYMLQGKLDEAETTVQEVLTQAPEDAQAMIIAGRITAHRRKFEKAREWMNKALSVDPNYGEAKFWLAQLYRSSDPEESLKFLEAVDPSDPSFEKSLLLRSTLNMQRGQMAEAATDLRRLIDFRPGSIAAHRALAQLYMATDEPRRAAAILEELIPQYRDADLLVQLGDALVAQRRFADALKRYEEARAIEPERPDALIGEARCLVALNRKQDALDRIQHMLNQFPNEAWPRLALVALYEGTRDFAKAIEALQNGLLNHPDWEMGYVRLAEILRRLAAATEGAARDQRLAESRRVLQDGLAKLPDSLAIRTTLAGLNIDLGDFQSAKRVLEPVARRFQAEYTGAPEDVDRLRGFFNPIGIYALALYYTGEAEEAITWSTTLWNLNPLDVQNANNLAYILAEETQDYTRAEELVRRCLRLMQNNPQVLDTAGWIAFKREDYERATSYFLESLSHGESAEAHYHLGRVYETRDRPEEAIEQYQKALDLGLKRQDQADAQKRIEALRKQRPS